VSDGFFDEISDDEPTREELEAQHTLTDIAITKGHAYAQEYNPSTGRVEDKPNYHALKQGYVEGFLAGFAHRIGGGHGGG